MKKSCGTCVYARWQRTAKGKRRPGHYGKCAFAVDRPKIPSCMLEPSFYKQAIWPKDGAKCECWE